MNGGRARARVAGLSVMVTALVAGTASGCGAPRPGLSNGSVSSCYRAIPTARDALHDDHSALIGVHREAADTVRGHLPDPTRAVLANENDSEVCVLSFKGKFATGQVDMAPASEHGPYAVVIVSSRSLQIVATVVLASLPGSLGKRTV